MKTGKLFYYYFKESLKEVRENFKIYLIYIIALTLVSIIQIPVDSFFSAEDIALKFFSKTLFSLVPLLILSKILYVIKIRNFGLGDYVTVVWRYILYNFYYFSLLLMSLGIYVVFATFMSTLLNFEAGFLITAFLLLPFIYVVIFFSLSPYVAVFNDDEESVFEKSKSLASKNILLVIVNHIFSLIIPILTSIIFLINNKNIKIALVLISSVPEAIFTILMVLTTTKIYMYLTERD